MNAPRVIRWIGAMALEMSGLLALVRAARRLGPPSVLILRYHRVLGPATSKRFYRLGIEEEVFREQVAWLRRHYEILDLEEAVERLARAGDPGRSDGAAPAHGLAVVITFDDGYADNLATAQWLREEGIPVTIFLTAGPVEEGRPFFWERLALAFERSPALASADPAERRRKFDEARSVVKSLAHDEREAAIARIAAELGFSSNLGCAADPGGRIRELESPDDRPLTWDEARRLARSGVRLGGHTITHPLLTGLSDEEARHEIEGGQRTVAENLGGPVVAFAYPTGDVDERIRRITAESGVGIALTCAGGRNRPGADPLMLRRKGVGELLGQRPGGRFSAALWGAEIEGVFDFVRRAARIHRAARIPRRN